ncbi:MAG: hypothetical protein DI529_00280 [Chryseobacterium sp.]|nr:MAG: hypothetical protein DI529_00280 [Chryseobacterium sp.]
MKSNAELKTYFETGDKPTQDQFYDLIDRLGEGVYGTQNPPTLAQLNDPSKAIKAGNYYVQTSNGSSTGTEVQRALFNGVQLVEWTVTTTVWNGLTTDQKNAVKTFNIIP